MNTVGGLEEGDLVNAKDGAKLVGISASQFYRVFGRIAIKVPGLGRRWLRADLLTFLRAHAAGAA